MHILLGPFSGLSKLGSSDFAAGILPSEASLNNRLKLKGVRSGTEAAV